MAATDPSSPIEEPTSARPALEPELAVGRARHDPYLALRAVNYRRFALGYMCSSFGMHMVTAALFWEVWERTQQELMLGLIGLARALPVIAVALPAGTLIDVWERRKVVVATQAGMALAMGGLAAVSILEGPVWVIFVLLVLMGCARSMDGPARASLLPSVVPEGAFHNAVTWNSSFMQVAATAGPILAGWLMAGTGLVWPLYIAGAAGCAVFSVAACFLRPRPVRRPPSRISLRSMLAGLSHIHREKTILAAITLDLFAVLLGGATALLPVYADEILRVGPAAYGWLRAAPFLGALGMALVLAHRPAFERAGPALLWSVAGYGAAIILFGVSTNLWLSLAALALSGALDNISVVVRHVLVQMRTPEEVRGRVSAVNTVFIESSNELGGFRAGVVGQAIGAVPSVVLGGIGTILVVLGVARAWPQIRRLGRLHET